VVVRIADELSESQIALMALMTQIGEWNVEVNPTKGNVGEQDNCRT
jgi:hypothetical protein